MNKREVVEHFVNRDFNFIPLSLVERAYADGLYDFIIQPIEPQEDDFETLEKYSSAYEDWECVMNDYYPTWGTLFECSDRWLGETILEHRNEVADLGFIILDGFDELNVCLGINAGGFDFYEAFWMPLYDLLGYKWHDEN